MTRTEPGKLPPADEADTLRRRVAELEAILAALAAGQADALVVPGGKAPARVLLREGSELPYLAVLESMNEGAITLSAAGDILYSNSCFARFVGLSPEAVRGRALQDFLADDDRPSLAEFLKVGRHADCKGRYRLRVEGGEPLPVQVSAQPLRDGGLRAICAVVTDMSASEAAAHALQASEKRWRQLSEQWSSTFDAVADPIFMHDRDMRLLRGNRAYLEAAGVAAEAASGRPYWEVFPKEHSCCEMAGIPAEGEVACEIVEGERFYRSRAFPVRDGDGEFLFGIHILEDITLRRHAEEQLRLAARVFDRAGEGIVVTDARGMIVTVNAAFTHITGYTATEVVGQTPRLLKSGCHDDRFYQDMWAALREHGGWQGEVWNRRKNGEVFPEWLTISDVRGTEGEITHYVGIFSDISAIRESRQRIEFLATHDELTGLPNRSLFLDRVHHAISRFGRLSGRFALCFVDLDDFKVINDSLGHAVGDLLLKETAARLKNSLRGGDTVARFGGDEFVLLIEEAGGDDAGLAAQRIIAELSRPFALAGQRVYAGASVGIALFPDDGTDADTLLKNADSAMYQAKTLGKRNHQFFSSALRQAADERLLLETGLRRAIERNEFFLLWQPQVELASGRLVGVEALIRWSHPERGLVPPDKFIPLAEKTRLIDDIGEWVADGACRQMRAWLAAGCDIPRVSINVSAEQFQRTDIPALFARLLERHGLPAERVMLELTESALIANPERVRAVLQELKGSGMLLSIDDFGTGYSSLAYLRRFPVDELKIDRCFVENIENDPDAQAIARTIVAMASTLGLAVIAEGIETARQSALLRDLGCRCGQGFFFGRPLEASRIASGRWR